ncbi:pentapeptide repeat-containing protein [Aliinostoc sp. HNIBRCY26]|uniref:pentapeptide repeat-containing protein n=1 Tax=Aliinostoc sp. HNIBRCY26 TaxID=3418997 RepID=UPI003D07E3E8
MTLSIRHWLAEHQLTISYTPDLTVEQLAGVAYRIVQDMEVKSLIPLDICTLSEVLELPLYTVEQEITVLTLLTESLLRSLSQKKALKRNEGTWLAFQIAYLQALQQVLHQEAILYRPWLNRAKIPARTPILQDIQLQGLLKTLSPGKLTDTQAEQALSLVADSLLVQQMNYASVAWFVANGAEEVEAKLLIQRLTHSLPGYLLAVIAHNALPLAQLQKFFRLGTPGNITTTELGTTVADKIDLQRENYRASLLQSLNTPLFMESFALKDIYIPLAGTPQTGNDESPVDLKTWVQKQLNDLETVTVIESEAGYGKTSFCQMWAAEIAREVYPSWMPILIRFRDIKYNHNLIETLNSGLAFQTHNHLATWLAENHPRCVILLDGLDELPPAIHSKRIKASFIQQLTELQAQSQHKIILTSRSRTLREIAPEILLQWRRIKIEPLTTNELKQWFQQWTLIQSLPVAQNFFTFLKQAGLFASKSKFPQLSTLVHQPLMLYLLGVLHRDGLLDDGILELANNHNSLLWEIHHRLQQWLLGYPLTSNINTTLQRSGLAHIHRTPEAIANLLSNHPPQTVIDQIQALSLKILHSDRHQITQESAQEINLPVFYFRIRQAGGRGQGAGGKVDKVDKVDKVEFLTQSPIPSEALSLSKCPQSPIPNPQSPIPSPQSPIPNPQSPSIEFSHPRIGRYLCAKAVAHQLAMLTHSQRDIYGTESFLIDSPSDVAQHVYNLLGYGVLNQEITELAIASLRPQFQHRFSWEVLIQRLQSFWYGYCQGRWLDAGIAHTALSYFHTLQNPLNVEHLNTYVGINVFFLLAEIHREIQVPFAPCGHPSHTTDFYPEALLMLLAKAMLLDTHVSKRICTKSLTGIDLSGASLSHITLAGANFQGTNLTNAALIDTNLTGVNLKGANLSDANLTNANLTAANLSHVNLTNTNLTGTNLTNVSIENTNFTNACLSDAVLSAEHQETAKFGGALFSLEQFQALKVLLSQQTKSYLATNKDQTQFWDDNSNVGTIESLEGELILSTNVNDDGDDETIFGEQFGNY